MKQVREMIAIFLLAVLIAVPMAGFIAFDSLTKEPSYVGINVDLGKIEVGTLSDGSKVYTDSKVTIYVPENDVWLKSEVELLSTSILRAQISDTDKVNLLDDLAELNKKITSETVGDVYTYIADLRGKLVYMERANLEAP